jgi:hypothetical protein
MGFLPPSFLFWCYLGDARSDGLRKIDLGQWLQGGIRIDMTRLVDDERGQVLKAGMHSDILRF